MSACSWLSYKDHKDHFQVFSFLGYPHFYVCFFPSSFVISHTAGFLFVALWPSILRSSLPHAAFRQQILKSGVDSELLHNHIKK